MTRKTEKKEREGDYYHSQDTCRGMLLHGRIFFEEKVGFYRSSRKGQVAETMTWIVATIVLLVLVFLFIFFTSALANSKNVQKGNLLVPAFSSSAGTEQMLFALLTLKTAEQGKSVRALLAEEKYEQLHVILESTLQMFAQQGKTCSFVVRRSGERGALMDIGENAGDEEARAMLGDKEVTLRC